jgi:WD40 repeat protein
MGSLSSLFNDTFMEDECDISTMTLDNSGRRLITCNFENEVRLWNYNNGTFLGNLNLKPLGSLITNLRFVSISTRSFLASAGWEKMICLYQEMEKGQFWMHRQYVGHTADISALAGYANGIVSGSVNREIFLWALESANHQSRSVLPGGIAIDCMACLDSHRFIGDADGFLHIFLIPKLAPLQRILGHGLVVRHSLPAIGLDEFNSVLYT